MEHPFEQEPEREAALAHFERTCRQFRSLLRTRKTHCENIMESAAQFLVGQVRLKKQPVAAIAGCRDGEPRIEWDHKIVRLMLYAKQKADGFRGVIELRDIESPADELRAIGAYLFCYYETHSWHPGNQRGWVRDRSFKLGLDICPIQHIALAVVAEQFVWERELVMAEIGTWRRQWRIKQQIEEDSHAMEMILTRTWLAETIFNDWVENTRGW